jgi:hypothetical protein
MRRSQRTCGVLRAGTGRAPAELPSRWQGGCAGSSASAASAAFRHIAQVHSCFVPAFVRHAQRWRSGGECRVARRGAPDSATTSNAAEQRAKPCASVPWSTVVNAREWARRGQSHATTNPGGRRGGAADTRSSDRQGSRQEVAAPKSAVAAVTRDLCPVRPRKGARSPALVALRKASRGPRHGRAKRRCSACVLARVPSQGGRRTHGPRRGSHSRYLLRETT